MRRAVTSLVMEGGAGGGGRGLRECFSGGLSGCRTPREGMGQHPGRTGCLDHGAELFSF